MSKENQSKIRNYELQRNYYYDSHDKDGNYNGLTEAEWKEKIRKEWSCEKLKAKLVVLIFHYANNLHVHAIVNFETSISRSNALYLSKCSKIEDCIPIDKKHLSNRYKYLLHIDEKSLKLKKHIYGQNDLEIFAKDNKKFDYHKMIACTDEAEQTEQDEKKLLKKVINDILNGSYGDIYNNNIQSIPDIETSVEYHTGELSIYQQILLNKKTQPLLLSKTNERKILHAIAKRKDITKLKHIVDTKITQKQADELRRKNTEILEQQRKEEQRKKRGRRNKKNNNRNSIRKRTENIPFDR